MSVFMSIPDITIIITSYNYSKYIDRCIRSCVKQNNVKHEVIVVDDCSTDNTDEVIEPWLSDIRYYKMKKNVGVSEVSNYAIKKAKGRFFIRVDADDYINEDTCFFMEKFMKMNRNAFGVACDYEYVDKYENKIERITAKEKPISCGVMYRKDLFLKTDGYNGRYKEHEKFLMNLDNFYKVYYLEMPFYRYRMHDSNKTKSKEYKKTII